MAQYFIKSLLLSFGFLTRFLIGRSCSLGSQVAHSSMSKLLRLILLTLACTTLSTSGSVLKTIGAWIETKFAKIMRPSPFLQLPPELLKLIINHTLLLDDTFRSRMSLPCVCKAIEELSRIDVLIRELPAFHYSIVSDIVERRLLLELPFYLNPLRDCKIRSLRYTNEFNRTWAPYLVVSCLNALGSDPKDANGIGSLCIHLSMVKMNAFVTQLLRHWTDANKGQMVGLEELLNMFVGKDGELIDPYNLLTLEGQTAFLEIMQKVAYVPIDLLIYVLEKKYKSRYPTREIIRSAFIWQLHYMRDIFVEPKRLYNRALYIYALELLNEGTVPRYNLDAVVPIFHEI